MGTEAVEFYQRGVRLVIEVLVVWLVYGSDAERPFGLPAFSSHC